MRRSKTPCLAGALMEIVKEHAGLLDQDVLVVAVVFGGYPLVVERAGCGRGQARMPPAFRLRARVPVGGADV